MINVETEGKCCVIVGKSDIVGKPMSIILSNELDTKMTTICCDKYTKNLKQYTRMADLLIVAAGYHHLITADHVKEGVTILDVGINKIIKKDGKKN